MKRSTLIIRQTRTVIGRAVASALIPAMALMTVPMPASAAPLPAPDVNVSPQLAALPASSVIPSARLSAIAGGGSPSAVPASPLSLPSPVAQPPSVVPSPPKVKVNRTVPKVTAPSVFPVFSSEPTAAEIFRARVFSEPLVAIGETTPAENADLAQAITAYVHGASPEAVAPFETFLENHGNSPWRASLLANLASLSWRAGHFTRAIHAWEEAWQLAKDATEPNAQATADRAVGELMRALSRFGRAEELKALSAEVGSRVMRGAAAENVRAAREGLSGMLDHRSLLMPSAAVAIARVLSRTRPNYQGEPQLADYHPAQYGVTLVEARALAERVGLKLQMAWRPKGSALVVPSILHLRLDHYAAIVAKDEARGLYLMDDPFMLGQVWLSEEALSEDASGYALIAAGALPEGWREVRESEGRVVVGRCILVPAPTDEGSHCTPGEPCCSNGGGGSPPSGPPGSGGPPTLSSGMPTYQLLRHKTALRIADTPVGYSPARGPSVQFQIVYNHREPMQPQIFSFSNLGPRWSHNFLSYIEDDPASPAADIRLFLRGGGFERERGGNGQSYAPHWESFNVVVRTSASPIRYEVRHTDGSTAVYSQPDGAMTSPRRVFLTDEIDPQGNTLHWTYDAQLRLVALTDALGQVTTVSYEDGADPLKITRVTDPFGRSAVFEYDGNGALVAVTDVIGLRSEFGYNGSDFIASMTTPYGKSSFRADQTLVESGDLARIVEATDPTGDTERVEYHFADNGSGTPPATEDVAPTGFADSNSGLNVANTYYWDKRATALYPGDYTKAVVWHWLKASADVLGEGTSIIGWDSALMPVLHSEKKPLERRVWYAYVGMAPGTFSGIGSGNPTIAIGHTSRPSKVARVLDDGSSQIYSYQYNSLGKTTRSTDPLGRTTLYVYAPNGIDLLQVRQVNGTQTDLLASYTYNDKHQQLTAIDAAGQTTAYTYDPTTYQLLTVTTPPTAASPSGATTTYAYNTNGQLTSITGPVAGATTTFEYDGYGRLWRVTNPDGYAVTTQYDALDRVTTVTYPDGTYEQTDYDKLDAAKHRDRMGRWTQTFYDALRRPVAMRDPAGRIVQKNEWVSCPSGCGGGGAKISKVIDANGNATTWEYDLEGRVTQEIRANGAAHNYTYENTTRRLASIQDPNGNVQTYSYNRDDTVAGITYQPGSGVAATPNVSFTYDPVYRRAATATDGTGTTNYTYYPVGVLGAGDIQSVDGPLTNDTITYSYDELGRVNSKQVGGSSRTETQTFDALGRLTQITNPLGNFTYAYDGVTGRPLSVTYPNGQQTAYAYFGNTGDHRLQEIWNKKPGGATLSKFDYAYNAVGNILTWQQQTGTSAAQVYQLGYDAVDQLTSAILQSTDPTPVTLKRYYYGYDPAGNRTAAQNDDAVIASTYNNMNQLVSQAAGGALTFKGTVSEPATVTVGGRPATVTADNHFTGQAVVPGGTGQVAVAARDMAGNVRTNTYQVSETGAGASLAYDANGNLTSDGVRTFTWDAENRLVGVAQGGTTLASFTYDRDGIRKTKTAGGVTTTYVLDGNSVVEERPSTGGTIKHFHGVGIDNVLATMDASGIPSYYVRDHLRSMRQRTDVSGQPILTRDYDPWGNVLAGAGTGGWSYTGREWDPETSLYYYRARYYAPATGRFVIEDPLGTEMAVTRYAYVNNNPANLVDPKGLQADSVTRWHWACFKQLDVKRRCACHCAYVTPQDPCVEACEKCFSSKNPLAPQELCKCICRVSQVSASQCDCICRDVK
jgi:RHS repeat-associated protein